jgi:hypothetical protein
MGLEENVKGYLPMPALPFVHGKDNLPPRTRLSSALVALRQFARKSVNPGRLSRPSSVASVRPWDRSPPSVVSHY